MSDSEWSWLQGELRLAATAFAETLRPLDGTEKVPGLDWTVSQLGAHVAQLPRFYRDLAARQTPLPAPDDWDEFGLRLIEDFGISDPTTQADHIEKDMPEWLAELGDDGAAPMMWWTNHHVAGVGAAALGELLLHRRDLAALTGEKVTILPDQARAILDGILPGSVAFVNAEAARRCAGTVHFHIRGGSDWTFTVTDGDVVVTPGKPKRADIHFSVEPVDGLLASYGRTSQVKSALLGRSVMWGRKPWLALKFAKLFEPI